ncbi:MAG: endonuclease/exonuclease/phosphatase family protein [Bacteroidales bacterium]
MKFIILFLLLFTTSLQAQELIIMTYNIRYANPGDGPNIWDKRKDKLCSLILEEKPDLLGVQEALAVQMRDLDSLLPGYDYAGVGRDDGKEQGEYAPVFYKSSRFQYIDGGNFWLSDTPEVPGSMGWDAACTRIVTWVKLRDKTNDQTMVHFNTHFDHVGVRARKQSARLLRHKIRSIAGKLPVIVSGDFNCEPASKPMAILLKGKPRLKDSRSCALSKNGPAYTYSTFDVNGEHGGIIDHILTSKRFLVNKYTVRDDHHEGHYYSDHLPVVVQLQLGK